MIPCLLFTVQKRTGRLSHQRHNKENCATLVDSTLPGAEDGEVGMPCTTRLCLNSLRLRSCCRYEVLSCIARKVVAGDVLLLLLLLRTRLLLLLLLLPPPLPEREVVVVIPSSRAASAGDEDR